MTNDNVPLKMNNIASNLLATQDVVEQHEAETERGAIIFGQSLHHFPDQEAGAQCYTATVAVDLKRGYPLAFDLRPGFVLPNGAMSCLRKALELLTNPGLCPPSMALTGKAAVDVIVEPEWRENIYFTSVVEACGGYVRTSASFLSKGPVERYLALAGHFLERHGPVSSPEVEGYLLEQMRNKWLQKKLSEDGWYPESLWQEPRETSMERGRSTRLHSIAYVGSPLQRPVSRNGVVKVLGKSYQNELTKALASGRRKKVCQTFYVNPWDDSAIYILDRRGKGFVEVPQVNNLLKVLGIRASEIKVRWPADVEKPGRNGSKRPK